MATKWTTKKNSLPSVETMIKDLNGVKVNVGVLEGEHAWLARIHEYGCKIPVTDKMRKWFAAQGYPLKKTTTVITIPERSFLRAGYDQNIDSVIKEAEGMLPDVMLGTMSVEEYAKAVGLTLAGAIKEYAVDLRDPPNSGMTVERKGSSNPLVDTGSMIDGITYEVER